MTCYLLGVTRVTAPSACGHFSVGGRLVPMSIIVLVLVSHSLILAGCVIGLFGLKAELAAQRVRARHARR